MAGECRWIECLANSPPPAAIRQSLAQRFPGFTSGRLERLAILGAAEEGRRLAELCARHGIEVVTLADDNPGSQGSVVEGHRVVPSTVLTSLDRSVPVVVASHRLLDAMARLRALQFKHVAGFAVLQVLDPDSFPPHTFYDRLIEDLFANRNKLLRLFETLGDDRSRCVLDAAIGFRLTLDPELLRPIIDRAIYDPDTLFRQGDHEIYVDGGSYDGDSVRHFIDRVGNRFSRILAFEPDPETYRRLEANFADDPRIETINKGLHAKAALLRFEGGGGRGSSVSEGGAAVVPTVALDEILGEEKVTFIKMNIEGAELEALQGARKAISRWAPRLAISVYHRPSDLWQVPAMIHQLRPKYGLYLRQHDGGLIETVAYAV